MDYRGEGFLVVVAARSVVEDGEVVGFEVGQEVLEGAAHELALIEGTARRLGLPADDPQVVEWMRHGPPRTAMREQPLATTRVRRDDWNWLAMVAPTPIPAPNRQFSRAEFQVLELGHRPADMDDMWFVFMEDDTLFLHRSWTGTAVFEATFERIGDTYAIVRAVVCGDASTYRRQSDDYESNYLELLIADRCST